MRPGQQNNNNKRMRGRGRKGPNPLSRSYESNGPDVKIRGTAQHIAERYATLARDATSAGDRVMAENYFQHAEHYGRIVAAAQGSFQPAQAERDYDETDDDNEGGEDAVGAPRQDERGNGAYRDRSEHQGRSDHQGRDRRDDNREARGDRPDRGDRQDRGERENGRDRDREGGRDHRGPRDNRERGFRDRRDGNVPSYGRDRNDGGEDDRNARGERRFENRDRREGGESAPERESDVVAAAGERHAAEPETVAEAPARRRGRPPRVRLGDGAAEDTANAELPSAPADSPASVSADSPVAADVAGEAAPRRRGRPPRSAAPTEESASAPEADAEAPVKRRPGRPRKVKPEDDGGGGEGGGDRSDLPAFLLASNG